MSRNDLANLPTKSFTQTLVGNPGWVIATVMLLAILEVLDSTIVNVALPSMMASLGANQDEITWVLTSYVVASAVVLPITGFLTNVIGRRRFLILCASGFMLSSFLCGASTSLSEIVFFRILQGACGASLIPISQTILRETFPLEQQGKAMAIWGLGILVAPVLGPTLGGFITEYSTWRWVFYINLPFCILGLILILLVIPKVAAIKQRIDYIGLVLMVVGVAALQIFLDKGNQNGWFESNALQAVFITSVFALIVMLFRTARSKNPIINMRLYLDRNFSLSSILMMLFCGTIFSFVTIQPILLENYFGYSAIEAGLTMCPLGISSAFGMALASQLMYRMPVKYLLTIALLIAAAGLWHESHANLTVTRQFFIESNLLMGFGMGLMMVPLSAYVFVTLQQKDIGEASGLFSYARMLGTSVGVSLISTLVSHMTEVSWHDLVAHITTFNPNLTYWLNGQNLAELGPMALMRLNQEISKQSGLLAFLDAFRLLSLLVLVQIPLALLLKNVKMSSSQPTAGH